MRGNLTSENVSYESTEGEDVHRHSTQHNTVRKVEKVSYEGIIGIATAD